MYNFIDNIYFNYRVKAFFLFAFSILLFSGNVNAAVPCTKQNIDNDVYLEDVCVVNSKSDLQWILDNMYADDDPNDGYNPVKLC